MPRVFAATNKGAGCNRVGVITPYACKVVRHIRNRILFLEAGSEVAPLIGITGVKRRLCARQLYKAKRQQHSKVASKACAKASHRAMWQPPARPKIVTHEEHLQLLKVYLDGKDVQSLREYLNVCKKRGMIEPNKEPGSDCEEEESSVPLPSKILQRVQNLGHSRTIDISKKVCKHFRSAKKKGCSSCRGCAAMSRAKLITRRCGKQGRVVIRTGGRYRVHQGFRGVMWLGSACIVVDEEGFSVACAFDKATVKLVHANATGTKETTYRQLMDWHNSSSQMQRGSLLSVDVQMPKGCVRFARSSSRRHLDEILVDDYTPQHRLIYAVPSTDQEPMVALEQSHIHPTKKR